MKSIFSLHFYHLAEKNQELQRFLFSTMRKNTVLQKQIFPPLTARIRSVCEQIMFSRRLQILLNYSSHIRRMITLKWTSILLFIPTDILFRTELATLWRRSQRSSSAAHGAAWKCQRGFGGSCVKTLSVWWSEILHPCCSFVVVKVHSREAEVMKDHTYRGGIYMILLFYISPELLLSSLNFNVVYETSSWIGRQTITKTKVNFKSRILNLEKKILCFEGINCKREQKL